MKLILTEGNLMANIGKSKKYCIVPGCGKYIGVVGNNRKYCDSCVKERKSVKNREYRESAGLVKGVKYKKQHQENASIIPDHMRKKYDHGFGSILDKFKSRRTPEEYQRCLAIAKGC